MKQLVCDMCGSTDLVRNEGVFVCQSCGCKYSIEEARRMMVEGTVQVEGTVKVDNSDMIANYLDMAEHALSASNEKEAEEYCNKIIELDPNNYKAWMIKGKAAGWSSTTKNNRVSEAIQCFKKAIDNAPEEELESIKQDAASTYFALTKAMLDLRCDSFRRYPSEEAADNITNWLKITIVDSIEVESMTGATRTEMQRQMAIMTSNAAIDAWNDTILPEYSNEKYRSKYDLERFIDRGDAAIKLLVLATAVCDEDDEDDIKRYTNAITINTQIRDAYSTTYSNGRYVPDITLTKSSKEGRNKQNSTWKAKADERRQKIKQEQAAKQKAAAAEQQRLQEAYWAEHPEEKACIDRIAALEKELSSLGLFQGKRKAELKTQIEAEKTRLKQLQSQ